MLLRTALVCGFVLLTLLPSSASAQEAAISGVYEIGIGTQDLVAQIEYWQRFGYRIGETGSLDAETAERLYGVRSAVRSVRLAHQDSDHGLLRLFAWEQLESEGLALAGMKVLGGRWGAMLTTDVYRVVNHAEDAVTQGHPVVYVEPQRQVIYDVGEGSEPFLDDVVAVREMLLVRPETRQILFQRYGYTVPLYGKVAADAPFPTSQVTHAGLVIQGGPEITDFYEDVLGLKRARDGHVSDYDELASRNVFGLEPHETYVTTDFDDPRSDPVNLSGTRSGRLKLIRFPADLDIPDLRSRSRPGHAGYSLYTYRVRDLEEMHARVRSSDATAVTEIVRNEFGEPSFTFESPDGNVFAVIGGLR